MGNKIFYGMSGIYKCPRVISAERLGYEGTPQEPADIEKLKHYTRMEAIAAAQLTDLGYDLVEGGKCTYCENVYKNIRMGIHVEIDTAMYEIVGHMDRLLLYNGRQFPIEIKSAGKSTMTKFASKQFEAFQTYAGQECCYLHASKSPGVYFMMNRDSGENLKYVVNDFKNELNLPGFEKIELPIKFQDIIDRLNSVEIDVQEGKLSEAIESDDCFFCKYKFLCNKEEDKKAVVVKDEELNKASKEYIKGLNMIKDGEKLKKSSTMVLLNYAKSNSKKFKTNSLSVSYTGQRTKKWLDEATIRKNAPAEVIRMAERESDPFDSYTIRQIKEKGE